MKFSISDLLICITMFIVAGFFTVRAETLEPHDHQGKLTPYAGEPPSVEITDEERVKLEAGEAVFKKIKLDKAQRGIAIFRVNADPETIWSVIKDFNSYTKWINDIEATELYQQHGNMLYVRFTAGGLFGGKTVWHAVHDYPEIKDMERNWGTWKLDYDHRSDLDDSVGFWRVLSVDGNENVSNVIYSADLKLKGFLTSLFENTLIDSSLKDATQWVKVQAEKLQATNFGHSLKE